VAWEVRQVGEATVVPIPASLDAEALASLGELVQQLQGEGRKRLVFDLSGCDHVSSEGLRFFLQVARRIETQKGAFALAAPSQQVLRLCELSGVARLVQVFPSLEQAVQAASVTDRLAALAARVLALLARGEAQA
jgi:anti-anti-sigma factor